MSEQNGRRDFIKKGITGLAGAALLPSLISADSKNDSKTNTTKETKGIIYRTLGKTGIKVPIVSMGVMNADNPQLIKAAVEAGITHLDTAHYYSRGKNETSVGEAIKGIPRDKLIIATKARPTTVDRESAPKGDAVGNETVDSFIEKVNISLKRLGVDYVDILYLHSAKTKEDVLDEIPITAMKKLKQMGKIKHIGISTHHNEPEVIRTAVASGVYEVILTAYNFRQTYIPDLDKAIAEAANAGLGIVAMKTQAGVYWDKERTQMINMKAALKWALQNENIHTAIPGFTSFDQLETNMSAMNDLTLTPQEKEDLKEPQKTASNQKITGLYCQQCDSCRKQCAKAPDIPTLMRSYMYAYGYQHTKLAKETLNETNSNTIACTSCPSCTVKCPMNFNIKEKITDIHRLHSVPDDFLV